MEKNELLTALGIKPKNTTVCDDDGIGGVDFSPVAKTGSPFAICKDKWTERKGEEVCNDIGLIKGRDAKESLTASADFFSACFEYEPELRGDCLNTELAEYMEAVLSNPEFAALRVDTRFDECKTIQAARRLREGYEKFAEEKEKQKGKGKGPDTGEGDPTADKIAGEILGEASDDCETIDDLQKILGGESMGGSGEKSGTKLDTKTLMRAFTKVRSDSGLRKKFELAGRLRAVAAAKQKAKTKAGIDEVVGIENGVDVSKLLATELGRLGDETLELDFLRRYVDRQTLQRQHAGTERTARGPVVCVVDESGSMCGDKEIHAKALAITLAWVAQHQKRWYCMVSFTGASCGRYLICEPGKEPIWYYCDATEYNDKHNTCKPGLLREKLRGPKATLAFMESFMNGGSCLDLPVDVLPHVWPQIKAPKGKTDIIMITDCHLHVPPELGLVWNEFRRAEKARTSIYVVGERSRRDKQADLRREVSEYVDEVVFCGTDVADTQSKVADEILGSV